MSRARVLWFGLVPFLVCMFAASVARAECKGCVSVVPPGENPVPLLVVLHGDWGAGPSELAKAWQPHALARNVAVLSLACPRDLGCTGSWWRWDGDPKWIGDQVDALAAKRPIDRTRLWIAGWSGGASYMGLRAQELQKTFAALVYHGGGVPPETFGCGERRTPVLFLSGTANPLAHLAVRLREHHETCKDEVSWQSLPNADHAAEWKALEKRGPAVIDWLLAHHGA